MVYRDNLKKRLGISIIAGAILGVFCIIGVGYRVGFQGNEIYLASVWYNRVVMGLAIGLAGNFTIMKSKANPYIRGALIGLFISFASLLSTEFMDIPSFFAGVVYGIIIDGMASKYG